jgi:hypothetical protein
MAKLDERMRVERVPEKGRARRLLLLFDCEKNFFALPLSNMPPNAFNHGSLVLVLQ